MGQGTASIRSPENIYAIKIKSPAKFAGLLITMTASFLRLIFLMVGPSGIEPETIRL